MGQTNQVASLGQHDSEAAEIAISEPNLSRFPVVNILADGQGLTQGKETGLVGSA